MTNFARYKNLIPALVLTGFSVYSAIVLFTSEVKSGNMTTSYTVLPQHYGAFAAVALCLLSFFFARKLYRYVLAATLVLGIISLLNFTVNTYWYSLAIGALKIAFQPFSLAIAILTLALNWQKVQKYLSGLSRKNEKANVNNFNEDVEVFKVKYLTLPTEELHKIIADNRFRPEAIEAAKQLLEEQEKMHPEPSKN